MHFKETESHQDYIARLVFECDKNSLLINYKLAEKFLNNKFNIKSRIRKIHIHNEENGTYNATIDKECWLKLLYLDKNSEPRYINKKEEARIEQSQRMLARILDKKLCAWFNGLLVAHNDNMSNFRQEQKNYGFGGLKRQYGENWKKYYNKIQKEKRLTLLLRNRLRHINRDQIIKIQELRHNGQNNIKFTIIDKNINIKLLLKLIKKQNVRTDKSFSVNMPIVIDDYFFDTISI